MHERLIVRLRRHIGAVLALKQALGWLAVWAFAWGTLVLVWRVALNEAPEWLWWGLAAAPLVGLTAGLCALRRLPAPSALRALVDRSAHCGGLLMTAAEQPIGPWRKSLPAPVDLRVQWRGGRTWGAFLLAVLFLSVTLLFPQSLASWVPEPQFEIGTETEKLAAQIDVLKEEAVLDPQKAEVYKDKLKQLKDEASGKHPVKTLEALDHLRNLVTQAAREAADAAVRKTEKLGTAEGLSEGLRQNEGLLDPKVQKEAMDELAALVQKAAAETDLLDKHLDPELLKALQSAKLTPEELKKLSEALKGCKADLAKMLGKLHAAKLIDAELLGKCLRAGMCDCTAMLRECGGSMSIAEILARCQEGQAQRERAGAGKGGVTEGPGSAPIAWNHDTREEGAKFKEETLPPADLAKLKESLLMGLGRADPKNNADVTGSKGGNLASAARGGGAANTQVVLPRHKNTIERFFARPRESK
jgi:hypothetical protein